MKVKNTPQVSASPSQEAKNKGLTCVVDFVSNWFLLPWLHTWGVLAASYSEPSFWPAEVKSPVSSRSRGPERGSPPPALPLNGAARVTVRILQRGRVRKEREGVERGAPLGGPAVNPDSLQQPVKELSELRADHSGSSRWAAPPTCPKTLPPCPAAACDRPYLPFPNFNPSQSHVGLCAI